MNQPSLDFIERDRIKWQQRDRNTNIPTYIAWFPLPSNKRFIFAYSVLPLDGNTVNRLCPTQRPLVTMAVSGIPRTGIIVNGPVSNTISLGRHTSNGYTDLFVSAAKLTVQNQISPLLTGTHERVTFVPSAEVHRGFIGIQRYI